MYHKASSVSEMDACAHLLTDLHMLPETQNRLPGHQGAGGTDHLPPLRNGVLPLHFGAPWEMKHQGQRGNDDSRHPPTFTLGLALWEIWWPRHA